MHTVETYILLSYKYNFHTRTVSGAGPDLLGLQARLVYSTAGAHAIHCTE